MRTICLAGLLSMILCNCSHESSVVSTKTSGEVCEVARTIEIGVWGTSGDCDGEPKLILTVDASRACFGWERTVGGGDTRWNSATNFRCYNDRLCYSQHPNSGSCEAPLGTTDKQWLSSCSAGAMILSGIEDCPDAPPEGCPLSDQQEGTAGLSCDNP